MSPSANARLRASAAACFCCGVIDSLSRFDQRQQLGAFLATNLLQPCLLFRRQLQAIGQADQPLDKRRGNARRLIGVRRLRVRRTVTSRQSCYRPLGMDSAASEAKQGPKP